MSAASPSKSPEPIRLVFKLERAEHPRLFDELMRFHKGVKRVNRLRVLAYDGLLAQYGLFNQADGSDTRKLDPVAADEGSARVTNDLFAPALAE